MAKLPARPKKTVTTMRLHDDVMMAAAKRAEKQGVTRTFFVEQVLRKELGMGKSPVAKDTGGASGIFD